MNSGNERELLDIFLEEAKDLLNAISATIQTWGSDLNNKTCFSELKRDLHTLKGGARMMNQLQLSKLSHELESLCEGLLSGQVTVNRSAYDLVCRGQDRMHMIIEAIARKESSPSVEDLINQFKEKMGESSIPTPKISSTVPKKEVETEYKEKMEEFAIDDFIRVRANLLEKLNNLSIESNILRVNIGHHINNFNTHLAEMIRLIKLLKEKLRVVPRVIDLGVTSEIVGLTNLSKNFSQVHANIESLLSQQSRIELELQDRLVDTRMIPFNSIIPRLTRITRQIATELKKKIDITILQAEGEIDRNLLEHLVPSLEHLLRNALDHGIESPEERLRIHKSEVGKINLRFFRMGNEACIEISDDGAGIDLNVVRKKAIKLGLLSEGESYSEEDIVRCILEPGFSTRDQISEISGRGVGMDVVNTVVKGLGGNLTIESELGIGSKFIIRLPFTTSVNRALLVMVQGQTFGILLSNIENMVLLNAKQAREILNRKTPKIQYKDNEYQLKYLGDALGIQEKPSLSKTKENLPVLLFNFSDYNAALLVDHLAGSQEVVVQSLGPQFKLMDVFSGATLLADGKVLIILDVYSITARSIKKVNEVNEIVEPIKKQPVILVVDDSVTIRTITKQFLERHKYSVITAKDGFEAIEKLKVVKPDIILSDVEMPKMDGFQLTKKVREMSGFSTIPIIMITFCGGEEEKNRAKDLGINKFIMKPYQEIDLLETIEGLLEKK